MLCASHQACACLAGGWHVFRLDLRDRELRQPGGCSRLGELQQGPGNRGAWVGCRGFPGCCCAQGGAGCPSMGGTAVALRAARRETCRPTEPEWQGRQCSPYVLSGTPASLLCPKGCHGAPNASRPPCRACREAERKLIFLRRGEITARSSHCQLGRTSESTQVPFQSFWQDDAMSGQAPSVCCRCCGVAGDLGAEQEYPSRAEAKVRVRKAPCSGGAP